MTVRPAPVFSVLDHCGTVSVLFREKMTNKVGPADDAGQVSSIAIFFEKSLLKFLWQFCLEYVILVLTEDSFEYIYILSINNWIPIPIVLKEFRAPERCGCFKVCTFYINKGQSMMLFFGA